MREAATTQPKAVLFDAGGTLVTMDPETFGDTVEPLLGRRPDPDRMLAAHYRAMAAIADNHHLLAEGSDVWWPWWLAQFLQFAGLTPDPRVVTVLATTKGMWRHPLPGAIEGVAAVASAGYHLAVVSNADGHVGEDLAAAGFDGLFDVIIDSSIVGVSKPDPAIFTHALDALDVPPEEAWYVGDSRLFDLGAATAAGLAEFVLVDPLGLDEGYRPRITEIGELVGLLDRRS
jgi:putative hydrolase of the HAD superfamily